MTIKVTIEGPRGCGKTTLNGAFVQACLQLGLSVISFDEGYEGNDLGADVVIVEKQTDARK